MSISSNPIRILILTALILCNSACEKKILLDQKVAKGDWGDYDGSLQNIFATMTGEQKREFEEMKRELKYELLASHPGAAADQMNVFMREKIEGHTVREILLMGYTFRLQRAESQQSALLNYQKIYQKLRTRPGNDVAEKDLAELKQQQVDGLRALDSVLEATRGSMRALGRLPMDSINKAEPAHGANL